MGQYEHVITQLRAEQQMLRESADKATALQQACATVPGLSAALLCSATTSVDAKRALHKQGNRVAERRKNMGREQRRKQICEYAITSGTQEPGAQKQERLRHAQRHTRSGAGSYCAAAPVAEERTILGPRRRVLRSIASGMGDGVLGQFTTGRRRSIPQF